MSLNIYPVTLELAREVARLLPAVAAADPDLARQLRRAVTSVVLNVGEGMYSQGRNRTARYHTAMGSAREVQSCLEVSHAMGYAAPISDEMRARLHHVIGTLVRLVRPRPG